MLQRRPVPLRRETRAAGAARPPARRGGRRTDPRPAPATSRRRRRRSRAAIRRAARRTACTCRRSRGTGRCTSSPAALPLNSRNASSSRPACHIASAACDDSATTTLLVDQIVRHPARRRQDVVAVAAGTPAPRTGMCASCVSTKRRHLPRLERRRPRRSRSRDRRSTARRCRARAARPSRSFHSANQPRAAEPEVLPHAVEDQLRLALDTAPGLRRSVARRARPCGGGNSCIADACATPPPL